MKYNNEKVNGNQCIKLLKECINGSSNTYQKEWFKLNWCNGIDWENMNYEDALNIAKIVGLDKNSVETVVSKLNNNIHNKTVSDSLKMTFQAIKNKILKNKSMIGGNNNFIILINNLLLRLQELLKKKNKKINYNDLNRINKLIKNKKLIDKKYNSLIDYIGTFNNLLDQDKILIPNNKIELTLKEIEDIVNNNNNILKNNIMIYGNNNFILLINNLLLILQELLKNKNIKINYNDLNRINTLIKNKKLIDIKYDSLTEYISIFNNLLEEDKILLPNNKTELTLKDIEELVNNI